MVRADSTIAVKKETKERLEFAKKYPRETFDDVINRLLDMYDAEIKNKED